MNIINQLLIALLAVTLTACGSSSDAEAEKDIYLVSGQSNSLRCSFEEFEFLTNSEVIKIGRNGTHIDLHIDLYKNPAMGIDADGLIFVNGGADAKIETYAPYYIERMNHYRSLVHKDVGRELPFFISNIGYNLRYPDKHFDLIRAEINKQGEEDDWIVAYDGAQYFRHTGMLVDITHYSEEGCLLVTRALAKAVNDYKNKSPVTE